MSAPVKIEYPLEKVLDVKKRRVDLAEKVVKEKQDLLRIEQDKLKQREAERDKVKNHRDEKMVQLRTTLDHETTTDKVQQMKVYLKLVAERLIAEEKKVVDQKEQVTIAEKNLEMAKHELNKRRKEVEKLDEHKVSWIKDMKKELEILEGREMDEIGNIIHSLKQRSKIT